MFRDESFVVQVLNHVPLFCNPVDCSLSGFSVHGILQVRLMEWLAISFSRGASQPRDGTWAFFIKGSFFTI